MAKSTNLNWNQAILVSLYDDILHMSLPNVLSFHQASSTLLLWLEQHYASPVSARTAKHPVDGLPIYMEELDDARGVARGDVTNMRFLLQGMPKDDVIVKLRELKVLAETCVKDSPAKKVGLKLNVKEKEKEKERKTPLSKGYSNDSDEEVKDENPFSLVSSGPILSEVAKPKGLFKYKMKTEIKKEIKDDKATSSSGSRTPSSSESKSTAKSPLQIELKSRGGNEFNVNSRATTSRPARSSFGSTRTQSDVVMTDACPEEVEGVHGGSVHSGSASSYAVQKPETTPKSQNVRLFNSPLSVHASRGPLVGEPPGLSRRLFGGSPKFKVIQSGKQMRGKREATEASIKAYGDQMDLDVDHDKSGWPEKKSSLLKKHR